MGDRSMFEKYYSLAQSFSTQYLEAQVKYIKHPRIKHQAFHKVLKTRLLLDKKTNNETTIKKQ
jgi:hypothetical protein